MRSIIKANKCKTKKKEIRKKRGYVAELNTVDSNHAFVTEVKHNANMLPAVSKPDNSNSFVYTMMQCGGISV